MIARLYKLIPRQLRERASPYLSSFYLPVHYYAVSDADLDSASASTKAEAAEEVGKVGKLGKVQGGATVVAYFGVNEDRARLWAKRFLGAEAVYSRGGRAWTWSLEKLLRKERPDCNLVLIETNRTTELILRPQRGFKIPMWMQLCLDITRPMSALKKASSKLREQIPRKIRKHALEYAICEDEETLWEFFDNMLIPYLDGRHGDTAFLPSRDEMKRVFNNSDLLIVKKDGRGIAGGLVEPEGGVATLRYIGVRDNNVEYMKLGAVEALYYFAIVHAQEKGLATFNMGGTSPFLADGVAFFKLTFKPYVTRLSYLPEYPVKLMLRKPSARLIHFLIDNPFLVLRGDGAFDEIVMVDNSQADYLVHLDTVLKKTAIGRVKRIVFALKIDSPDAREQLRSRAPEQTELQIVSWQSVLPEQGSAGH